MNDRVSRFPGRVRLTQVLGDVYDMELADGATVAGTNLNKATFLTDAVANTLRTMAGAATAPSTPNEAFQMMADFLSEKPIIRFGSYVGTGYYGSANPNTLLFSGAAKLKALYILEGDHIWLRGVDEGKVTDYYYSATYNNALTWADNAISWYYSASNNSYAQLNALDVTYHYMAILEY